MKKLLKAVFYTLYILIIGSFLYSIIANNFDFNKASVLGYKINHVMSGSMNPIIQTDDYILSKAANFNDVKVGDIITYRCSAKDLKGYEKYQDEIIIHRVIEKNDDYLKTKGDANEIADPWNVYPNDVISIATYDLTKKINLLNQKNN